MSQEGRIDQLLCRALQECEILLIHGGEEGELVLKPCAWEGSEQSPF